MTSMPFADLAVFAGATALAAVLIVLLHPLLQRYALARPNARSSHRVPTPQGGGIAVMAAAIVVLAVVGAFAPQLFVEPWRLVVVFAAAAALAVVGAVDDIRPIEPWPRLLLQLVAVLAMIAALPAALRVVPVLPWWIERAAMAVAVLWLVNLVNFMDGIDWITVAEVVPVTAALALFGWIGAVPAEAALTALALCGAMLGFAPFNRPVAKLFLGDVGSLPIGLLLGWLFILLAEDHLAAALLLPLYYLSDATITLLRRFLRGERVMQAHRSHYYQRAVDGSLSVPQVVGRIFVVNVVLAALAAATLRAAPAVQVLLLLCGGGVVAALLIGLGRSGKRRAG
jgi:UDP-N-acetylmuramyl pentapeptide phosphotransferase/UDP-N-acetylglucosamine-1-phosphate transferase